MDERALALAAEMVTSRYIDAGAESLRHTEREVRSLLAQRRCREDPLPDTVIELLLHQLSLMDANQFAYHVSAGEREGRVFSPLVARRHYGFSHGVGRSGDLSSHQPKAAGSSLLYQLTNCFMLDFLQMAGLASARAACVVPMATGMTLALVLQAVLKQSTEDNSSCKEKEAEEKTEGGKRYVLWPRVDQKTALKCIDAAGLVPWPVELQAAPLLDPRTGRKVKGSAARHPYYLQVDMEDMEAALAAAGGPARVLCVLATTSCFCPRLPDPVLELSRFCHRHGIALVVNNAYGVQSNESTMRSLEAALQLAARTDKNSSSSSNSRKPNNPTAAAHAEVKDEGGRLDYIVQSSDKNFLVPVGGAVVTSHSAAAVASVAALYAGRASAAPVLDLFITALAMGRRGMRELWSERYKLLAVMMDRLRVFAKERDEELVEEHMADGQAAQAVEGSDGETKINQRPARNDISLAITIKHYWKHLNATEHVTVEEDEEATAVAVEDGHNSAQASGGVSALTQRRVVAAKQLGARLFRSGVTGPRVVLPSPDSGTTIVKQHNHTSNPRNHCNGNTKASSLVPEAEEWIEQRPRVTFYSYGSHHDSQLKVPLLVCACAIGMTHADLNGLMAKLEDLWPVDTHTRK